MRKWAVCLALAMLTAVFTCLPATAEGDGVTTYRAMLVGIDNYASSALAGCVTDANRMLSTLQTANEAGAIYQQPEIRTNLKASEISSFLGEMTAWGIDDDDVTFWYFAGHGYVSDKDVVSIVGTDAKTLRIDRLKDALDEVPGTKIVVLDCRYADSLIEKSGQTAKDVLQKFNTSVADIFLTDPEHYFVLSGATLASSVGSTADAHGLVTYSLTTACGYDYQAQKPGDLLGDADQNGAVSLSEAKAYIDAAVAAETGAPQVQVAVSPADTSYPVLARRANTEVLKVDMTRTEAEVATDYTLHLDASVSPTNASRPGLTWSSSDLGVATVDDTGTVTGVRAGTARIVAMSDNGLAAGCDITVRDVTFAESIKTGIAKLVMGEGTSYKMPLEIEPSDADEAITWVTDDATVAAVDKQGNISAKGLGDAVVTATTERGIQATVSVKVVNKGKEVSAIRMEKDKVALYEGNAMQLEYKLEPKNPADDTITWASSDPNVANMNASGLLVAEKPGVTRMTATASSGISASVEVTVKGAELTISPNPVTLKKGATQKLTAKILPSGLILTTTWKTDDPTIATVDDQGTVTAVANGLTAVTASLESGVTQTVMISVVDVPAKAIKLNKNKLKMTVGGQQELKAKVSPANATIGSAFWSSSNEAVATVDENGKITALAPGKIVITAKTHNGKKARCLLQVEPVALKSIKLSRSSATLTIGIGDENTLQLTADTNPVSAGASAVKWVTSDKKVATIDATGLVTAVAPGKAIIRAMSGKVKADCKITVTGNEAVYKKPVTGKGKKVYVSARRIYYKDDNLVVGVYFANKSGKVAKLPYAGKLILTLKDGQVFELKDVEKGKNSLMSGKAAKADYKFSLTDRPELADLDLRGASATIVSAADQAAQDDADLNGDATVEPSGEAGDQGDVGDVDDVTDPNATDVLDSSSPVQKTVDCRNTSFTVWAALQARPDWLEGFGIKTLSYLVPPEDDGRLLRRLVRGRMGVSNHVFSSLKVLGGVTVDGFPTRADQKVYAGQVIRLTLEDTESGIEPDPTPVNVVYEDEDILIVNKPAPLPCQCSSRQEGMALENRLAARYGGPYVFRPVNRLDKGTSGLMAVARHAHAQMLLTRALHSDEFAREYLAVVVGRPPLSEGMVDAPIAKADGATVRREVSPEGKPARTHYRFLEVRGGLSLLQLRLETGRTHQIRVHMQSLGCPVWGDFLYGTETPELPGRFALHSFRMALRHPLTDQPLLFVAPPPPEFGAWLCLKDAQAESLPPLPCRCD